MRVEDLTKKEYDRLEKLFDLEDSRPGALKRSNYLTISYVKAAMDLPFNEIPLRIKDAEYLEIPIFKFRLEKGI